MTMAKVKPSLHLNFRHGDCALSQGRGPPVVLLFSRILPLKLVLRGMACIGPHLITPDPVLYLGCDDLLPRHYSASSSASS